VTARKYTKAEQAALVARVESGERIADVAADAGVSTKCIQRYARARGVGALPSIPDTLTIWDGVRARDQLLARMEQGERLEAWQVVRELGWPQSTARGALKALERDGCAIAYRPCGNITVYEAAP
jgi:hypothetical protein